MDAVAAASAFIIFFTLTLYLMAIPTHTAYVNVYEAVQSPVPGCEVADLARTGSSYAYFYANGTLVKIVCNPP